MTDKQPNNTTKQAARPLPSFRPNPRPKPTEKKALSSSISVPINLGTFPRVADRPRPKPRPPNHTILDPSLLNRSTGRAPITPNQFPIEVPNHSIKSQSDKIDGIETLAVQLPLIPPTEKNKTAAEILTDQ